MKKIIRILTGMAVAAFFIVLVASIYFDIHYSRVMPRTPDPAAKRIHEMSVNHGTVVFVDRRELVFKEVLGNSVFYLAILGIVLGGAWQRVRISRVITRREATAVLATPPHRRKARTRPEVASTLVFGKSGK